MHFWINKGNQGHYWQRGCRLVRPPPEAVANYLARHQIIRPRGLYPKPMVTPVRRFQSLESVSNNGLRYSRSSPCHRPNRAPVHNNGQQIVPYNASSVPRNDRERSSGAETNQTNSQTLDSNELKKYIRQFKITLISFALISVCVFFGANYLTTGQLWRLGVETLVIISVALVVLLLGGIILLYLDERHNSASALMESQQNMEACNDELQLDDLEQRSEQRPSDLSIQSDIQEIPPPPYHIAIRFSNQNDLEGIQIIDDQSPPPPYEKAVTKCSLKKYQTNII